VLANFGLRVTPNGRMKAMDNKPGHLAANKAAFGPRFGALLLDQLIALPGYMLYIIPGLVIFGFRDSFTSRQSIGRKVTETRIVDVETGDVPTTGRLFARNLFAVLFRSLTLGIYTLSELLVHLGRPDGRCLTDLLFGTYVMSIEPAVSDAETSLSGTAKNLES